MPSQPDPALEYRTRTLREPPTKEMEVWRDPPVGGNTRGLMTGPVRELFQNKTDLVEVQLTFGEGVAVQYRRKQ